MSVTVDAHSIAVVSVSAPLFPPSDGGEIAARWRLAESAMNVSDASYRAFWAASARARALVANASFLLVQNATLLLAAAPGQDTRMCIIECVQRLARADLGAALAVGSLAELDRLLRVGWTLVPPVVPLPDVQAAAVLVDDALVRFVAPRQALQMPRFAANLAALQRANALQLPVLLNASAACEGGDGGDCCWLQALAWSLVFGSEPLDRWSAPRRLPPALATACSGSLFAMQLGEARGPAAQLDGVFVREFDVGHVAVRACDDSLVGTQGGASLRLNEERLLVVRSADAWRNASRVVWPLWLRPCEAVLLLRPGASLVNGQGPPAITVLPTVAPAAASAPHDIVIGTVSAFVVAAVVLCIVRSVLVRAMWWRAPWPVVPLLLFVGWLGVQAAVIGVTFAAYLERDEYVLLGAGVPLARSMAAALRINCALVLLPVSRAALTRLGLPSVHATAHKLLGGTIALQVALHVLGHVFNYHFMALLPDAQFAARFPTLVDAARPDRTPAAAWIVFAHNPGASGVALLALFVAGLLAALPAVRAVSYGAFEVVHQLALVPAMLLLCVHGVGGVLETPTAWMYMLAPLALYVADRAWRLRQALGGECAVVDVWQPTARVVEVSLQLPDARVDAFRRALRHGDFVCVARERLRDAHPFCVVSTASELPRVRLLVNRAGEWTAKLQSALLAGSATRMFVGGPFHSSGVAMARFESLVLCAGGMGITPFVSLLAALLEGERVGCVRRVTLLWSCRTDEHFFMLSRLLQRAAEAEAAEVRVRLFATQTAAADTKDEDDALMARESVDAADAAAVLGHAVEARRPDWLAALRAAQAEPHAGPVGVFVCGPRALTKEVHTACSQLSPGLVATRSEHLLAFHKLHTSS